MRKLALAFAAVAAGSIAGPSPAAVITTNYTLSGGTTGTLTLDFDDTTSMYTLTALNLTLPGGSTTFTTANAGLQFPLGPILGLGGNVSGIDTILGAAGQDDFILDFNATLASQTTSSFAYFIAGSSNAVFGTVNINQAGAAVPEPASWAMMLLGFGGIGFAMRRRQRSLAAA